MSVVEEDRLKEPVIRLGISTCLLGERVRYDGGHKLDRFLVYTLGQFVEWVPVCHEVEIGLPTPRESLRLVGGSASPRLVAPKSGTDYTDKMKAWARERALAAYRTKKPKKPGFWERPGFSSPSSGDNP